MNNNIYEIVKKIVEMVTNTNLLSPTRKREYVEARMIYAYIIRVGVGASLKSIGNTINKDHTTIIHYIRTMGDLLEVDAVLTRKYIRCQELLLLSEHPLNLTGEKNETSEINKLKEQIEILEKKNILLEVENKRIMKQRARFINVLELIEDRIPMGGEYLIERKIKKILNE